MAIQPLGTFTGGGNLSPAQTAPGGTAGAALSELGAGAVPSLTQAPPSMGPLAAAGTADSLQKALETLKQAIKPSVANSLQFSIDQDTGQTVVTILDAETRSVIRQIPSDEMLALSKAIDQMQGLLLNQQV